VIYAKEANLYLSGKKQGGPDGTALFEEIFTSSLLQLS
jgi:hypothetical protein